MQEYRKIEPKGIKPNKFKERDGKIDIMQPQEIDQVIIWTHPLFSYIRGELTRSEAAGLKEIIGEMKTLASGMARKRKTNTLLLFIQDLLPPNHPATRAEADLLKHCRKIFRKNLQVLSWQAGTHFSSSEKSEARSSLDMVRKAMKQYRISGKVVLLRAGQLRAGCPDVANKRVIMVLREEFGIIVPQERQREMRRITRSEEEATALLRSKAINTARRQIRKRPPRFWRK